MAALATPEGLRRPGPRIDLCAAALLQNRDEDDGGAPMQAHRPARMVYALGAALFARVPGISQAAAYSALTCAALGLGFSDVEGHAAGEGAELVAGLAEALALPAGASAADVLGAVEQALLAMGQPVQLRRLLPDADGLEAVAAFAGKSFNADREREFQRHPQRLVELLRRAW